MPTINATNVATVVSNGLSFNSTWMARRDATDGVTVDLSSENVNILSLKAIMVSQMPKRQSHSIVVHVHPNKKKLYQPHYS